MRDILKNLKLNENNISMLLGAAIIVVIGLLVINYFKSIDQGTTGPVADNITNEESGTLPTEHTVAKGESLWTIAEKYYKSGYNWVDIQKENNLTNASVISEGQVLTIPDVAPKLAGEGNQKSPVATESSIATSSATPTPTVIATAKPTVSPTPTPKAEVSEVTGESKGGTNKIDGATYVVVKGDTLWSIAERAYGDGYSWAKIARANNLLNPNVIHPGNVFSLPR